VRYTSLPGAVVGLHRRLSASDGVRRVVCVSRAAAALFPHCAEKVAVIHNALDVDSFDPALVQPSLRAELGLAPGAIVFGSHGRVLRRKGYIEMVRAARLALDRMSEDLRARSVFVVVGDTPEDFRPDHVAECRALAEQLGLGERFRMLGFRGDVRPLVADFDVAVVPSVYADPLPRSVIESMALGKPVIAYDVGGVVEMLQDGVTGELVHFEADGTSPPPPRLRGGVDDVPERGRNLEAGPSGDGNPRAPGQGGQGASAEAVARLADALVRYASDPHLRERQGRAARERVVRDFDARAHARRIQGEIVLAAGLSLDPA
jgi:glycosyltransferase involved in cell wall biosynthesis